MNAKAVVTVVIPAYNAERFLPETFESVLGQSMGDLQVIVVDDGSTEGTLATARSIEDPRARVLTGPNRGQSHARNAGLEAASRTDFVAFVDADDLWEPTKLQRQIEYLRQHPGAAAFGSFMKYNSPDGKPLGETGQVPNAGSAADIQTGRLLPFPISSCLIRRDSFDHVDGFDDSLPSESVATALSHLDRPRASAQDFTRPFQKIPYDFPWNPTMRGQDASRICRSAYTTARSRSFRPGRAPRAPATCPPLRPVARPPKEPRFCVPAAEVLYPPFEWTGLLPHRNTVCG